MKTETVVSPGEKTITVAEIALPITEIALLVAIPTKKVWQSKTDLSHLLWAISEAGLAKSGTRYYTLWAVSFLPL